MDALWILAATLVGLGLAAMDHLAISVSKRKGRRTGLFVWLALVAIPFIACCFASLPFAMVATLAGMLASGLAWYRAAHRASRAQAFF
jgi:hypothetical protein